MTKERVRIVVEEYRETMPGVFDYEERKDYNIEVPETLDAYEIARLTKEFAVDKLTLTISLIHAARSSEGRIDR